MCVFMKIGFPNPNGIWSWENQMNQVVLLLRNPRWAIPSFHTMRYELDFADDWLSSFYRIPYIYTERPAVALWNSWRDANFNIELQAYVDHLEFWMQGGLEAETGNISPYCADNDIDCRPKAVIDFENFYKENPDVDFFQLAGILDKTYNSTAVEMLAASARVCALDKVYEKTDLRHNNNRQGSGPTAQEFLFTSTQLQTMEDKLVELRDKYDALAQGNVDGLEHELVQVLNKYIAEISGEKDLMLQVETGY